MTSSDRRAVRGAGSVVAGALPSEVLLSEDGPVRIVTMNRPSDLNAANAAMHRGLTEVWRTIAADTDARAAVLTGAGRAFSAGADFAWLREIQADADYAAEVTDEARALLVEMVRFPLPLVAAVNGPAVGLGCSLAIGCDIVLLSDRAFLADPHVSVGLVAGDGGAALWPLMTSLLRAKEFVFTGDRIAPELAVQLGLANRVVPDDELGDQARALAHRLARQPRRALVDTKRAMNVHVEKAMSGVLDVALLAERQSMTSADHIEAIRSLMDGAPEA
jgi:enoyl-CoA hydratase/carnithine racemase